MRQLVPIKVKIGLRANGHADHPDWYQLPLAASVDPATHMFFGWKYDKTSGHKEASVDSPIGMQWGMVLVTPLFATQAIAAFPTLVAELSEVEAETFWNTKVTAHLSENKLDTPTLQGLVAELTLRKELEQDVTDLTTRIAKAVDPTDREPGVKSNRQKRFSDAKTSLDFEIVSTGE